MRPLLLLLIGLFFGGGIGFLVAASQGVTLDGHDHADPSHHAASDHGAQGHAGHTVQTLPDTIPAPTLAADLLKDAKGGWNLHLRTTNFRFAPEQVNQPNEDGAGHAHVYVNGTKIARLYGPWMHIAALPAGATVMVELNANDHSPLAVGDRPLRVDIKVPEDG